jgi:hypothetical protein
LHPLPSLSPLPPSLLLSPLLPSQLLPLLLPYLCLLIVPLLLKLRGEQTGRPITCL